MSVQPLPRWVGLPGDPAPLRAWLRRKRADEPDVHGPDLPPEPPPEEDR